MVVNEILGGLKLALARGETIKQAMMSFYNAGYKKQDIESAAKLLHNQQNPQQLQATKPTQQIVPRQAKQKPVKTAQKVSGYGEKPKRHLFLIFLIFVFLILTGALIGFFLFKEEILNFLSNLT